jgi:hypothetical protein
MTMVMVWTTMTKTIRFPRPLSDDLLKIPISLWVHGARALAFDLHPDE